jgi:hypothetical protein
MAAPEPPGAKRWGSKAIERVTVLEPSHLGSRDLELRDTWRRVDARPPLVLTWSLYEGIPGLQGTDSGPWAHLRGSYEPTGRANIFLPVLLI